MRRNQLGRTCATIGLVAACLAFVGCETTGVQVVSAVAYHDGAADLDISLFYSELAPHGEWIELADHGWVWTPYGVPVDWRPYTCGRWEWTVHGWSWVSDWEWGWIPFHYGRWLPHVGHGWVWVPDRVWGPAWVDWRWGESWVGWAPLPPSVVWHPREGLRWGVTADLDWSRWCFVDARGFLQPHLRSHIVFAPYNGDLMRRTRRCARYDLQDGRIVNNSIPLRDIEVATGKRVRESQVRTRRLEAPAVRDGAAERRPTADSRAEPRTGTMTPRAPTSLSTPAEIRQPSAKESAASRAQRNEAERQRLEASQSYLRRVLEEARPVQPAQLGLSGQTPTDERSRHLTEKLQRERQLLNAWQSRENSAAPRRTWSASPKFEVKSRTDKPVVPRQLPQVSQPRTAPQRQSTAPQRQSTAPQRSQQQGAAQPAKQPSGKRP